MDLSSKWWKYTNNGKLSADTAHRNTSGEEDARHPRTNVEKIWGSIPIRNNALKQHWTLQDNWIVTYIHDAKTVTVSYKLIHSHKFLFEFQKSYFTRSQNIKKNPFVTIISEPAKFSNNFTAQKILYEREILTTEHSSVFFNNLFRKPSSSAVLSLP